MIDARDFDFSDFQKEVLKLDVAPNAIYMASHRAFKMTAIIATAKVIPSFRIIVPNLKQLDLLVRYGVKPSQIILSSELKKPKSFCVIDEWYNGSYHI